MLGRRLKFVSHPTPELSTRLPKSLKGSLLSSGSPLILVYFSLYFSSYPKITQEYVRFFLFLFTYKALRLHTGSSSSVTLTLTFACLEMDSDYSASDLYYCFSPEASKEEFKEALK